MLRKDGVAHAERVYTAVRWSDPSTPPASQEKDRLLRSWQRSLEGYGLDPGRTAQPRILTGSSLRERQEPLEAFLRIARHGVRRLYEHVRDANYVVLLTDVDGVTIDFVGQPSLDKELKKAGLYLGSVWTESAEGTCGVGTTIIDKVPITVHKREHFRAPNTTLTCSAAPILDVDGSVRAILDASALYSPDDKRSQNLVLKFVVLAADMIENAYFLDRFKHAWVLQLSRSAEFLQVQTEYLIAFDEHGKVLAANRRAQVELLSIRSPRPLTLEDLFALPNEALLRLGTTAQSVIVHANESRAVYFGRVRAPLRHAAPAAAFSSVGRARPAPACAPTPSDRVPPAPGTMGTRQADIASNKTQSPEPGAVSERDRILRALRSARWQFAAAARALGISRATLYRKTRTYRIVSPNKLDAGDTGSA
jgi:transcriptional regulator of acetoin/glycerol metabolism